VKAISTIMSDLHGGKEKTKVYAGQEKTNIAADPVIKYMSQPALEKAIQSTRKAMEKAAKELDFIEAARLRDEMYTYEKLLNERVK